MGGIVSQLQLDRFAAIDRADYCADARASTVEEHDGIADVAAQDTGQVVTACVG